MLAVTNFVSNHTAIDANPVIFELFDPFAACSAFKGNCNVTVLFLLPSVLTAWHRGRIAERPLNGRGVDRSVHHGSFPIITQNIISKIRIQKCWTETLEVDTAAISRRQKPVHTFSRDVMNLYNV